jgi:hypothetical protein
VERCQLGERFLGRGLVERRQLGRSGLGLIALRAPRRANPSKE